MNAKSKYFLIIGILTVLALFLSSTKVSACSVFGNQKKTTAYVGTEIADAHLNTSTQENCIYENDLDAVGHSVDPYKQNWRHWLYKNQTNLNLFEGDILNVNVSNLTVAVLNKRAKWPNGSVPFVISPRFSKASRRIIHHVFEQYRRKTCIRFVPRTKEKDYIEIKNLPSGCSSSVGRQGGPQTVSLGFGCVQVGVIEHELMHVIGFWHEQSRPDRDKYVIVNWANIQPGMAYNFMKFYRGEVDTLRLPYDIGSIMHYGPFDFARDPTYPTLIPKYWFDFFYMGQRKGFSRLDIKKINRLYNCAS